MNPGTESEYSPRLSLVVPVFRSQEMLANLHRRIVSAIEPIDPHFELVLVEDCGGDDSWSVIQDLARADPRVRGIQLARNYGQHNALLCGIRAARGEVVVTLDDDLQNPPEEIPRLLQKLDEGYDVVYGTPVAETHGFLRDQASHITKLALQSAMGAETASKVSALRAFRTRLRDAFADYRSPTVNIDVLLTWGTTRFAAITVRQDERAAGASGYTLRKLFTHTMNMMTGFSTLPLQMASVVGFIFGALGFLMMAYVIGRYLMGGSSVPGFPFLASIIAIFSGVQLFALGIFGEYLARMHFRSMERPPYTVHEVPTKHQSKAVLWNDIPAPEASSRQNREDVAGIVETPHLRLEWAEAPWDSVVFGFPVLQISRMEVLDAPAADDLAPFEAARDRLGAGLVSCRLGHECLRESMLLEERGFRFIEMAYQPELDDLQARDLGSPAGLDVAPAEDADLPAVEEIAGNAFRNERFHVDPRLDSALGNQRYRRWVKSSISHPSQRLYVVRDGARLVAFFVTEMLPDGTCYWHLNAVAPDAQGQGYGRRAWLAMLNQAKESGARKIRTCIVARNHRVLNLYARLGFRFPPPLMTFHWVRAGA
jgi:undecaprenyl-phosphate 4-deoxy-4-formamido-L-arabinose transferase